ncbi:MAG: antibiotic biosynthesis monooxygenase family protein [Phototrophicaceae bacterium]
MITIRVKLAIQPDRIEDFHQAIETDISDAHNFEGCLHYQYYADRNASNSFLLYQEWESRSAFDAFYQSDTFKQIGSVLFPMIEGKPESIYIDGTRFEIG